MSGGVRAERAQESTRPNTAVRNTGMQEKLKPEHTHIKPQPKLAGRSQNPYPITHTLVPSQEWRGYRKTQTKTHTPQTPARNGGAKPKPLPQHTHPRPQPGMAGLPKTQT